MSRALVLVTAILSLSAISYHGVFAPHPNVVVLIGEAGTPRGSGVVIADGWILTAKHVLPVKSVDKMPCIKSIKHPTLDLALVQCPQVRAPFGFRIATRKPFVFDRVYAYGWHLGRALMRTEGYQGHYSSNMSAPVIHGCSGGAVVNARGELVGIVKSVSYAWTANRTDGYALPHMAGYTPIASDALDWILLHTE